MSLHLSLSTPCPKFAAIRGWQIAAVRVDFLYERDYGSLEEHTAEIGNQFNKDAGSFLGVEQQLETSSGRYRRKHAVPK
ncbi:MAG TPA: hypothetical protein V6D11_10770 [Waterburya sp.]